jgi:hypothetical protein
MWLITSMFDPTTHNSNSVIRQPCQNQYGRSYNTTIQTIERWGQKDAQKGAQN